jgi:predicted Zn-ribbon and HTH transcriptional regulator
LELDAIPPDHRFITHFICAHPACNQKVIANIEIAAKTAQIETAADVIQEETCNGCGFLKDDCQCEAT